MMNEDRFDQLLDEMRTNELPAGQPEAAVQRVWGRLQRPECAEYSAELPAFAAGERLLESRRLLIEDHVRLCTACRAQVGTLRGQTPAAADRKVVTLPTLGGRRTNWSKWAIAAGVAMMSAYAGRDFIDGALAGSGPRATVESVSGRLAGANGALLPVGAQLGEGDLASTGAASRATLRLRDGSLVEMNERSQLFVRAAWSGQRIHLERGDAIVLAAKQRRGRLQMITRDSTASVKGTIFAVSTGVAGSLVSVVEGAVEVERAGGAEKLLKPGEQVATSSSMQTAGVREAISWSPNADRYYAQLAELVKIEEQVAAVSAASLRTKSTLVARMPPGVWTYGAVPNADGSLSRAIGMVERRAQESPELRAWWESAGEMKTVLQRLQAASGMLGDEVVFMLVTPPPGGLKQGEPLILAEILPGREAALKEALEKLVGTGTAASKLGSAYAITGSLLIIAENAAAVARLTPLLGKGAASPFAQDVARRYQRGVGWLMAVDAAAIVAKASDPSEQGVLNAVGFGSARRAFIEQRGVGGRDDNEASIAFQGARQGVASWLAAPGSLAAADYISPQSVLAGAASVRNPRQAFDELVAALGKVSPDFPGDLRKFETETGISVGGDLVPSFGTDVAFSIENARLPMPGWVAAVEVYSPAAIDSAVKRMVDAFNKHVAGTDQAKSKIEMREETVSGRKWLSISQASTGQAFYWTYDRGYLVATMDRAVASRAIATRATGTPLVRSPAFQERLPITPGVHNSGFVWMSTRGALDGLIANQPPALKNLLSSRVPVLIMLNGETERIAAFSRTRLTSLLLDLMLMAPSGAGNPDGKTVKALHATTGD